MTPEFSRPERVDTIGEGERAVAIVADAEERAALARRFALVGVARLEASFAVRRDGGAVLATGRVTAAVTQACSITGEPIEARVDEPVSLRFVDQGSAAEEEVELSADAVDTLPIESGAVDLGEAAAETMALALDPFPRAPGADAALAEAGVLGEGQAGPFGALAGLKDKLGR
jgi:uncharacterized metal-binding protein YceD (DUF177 family)